MFNPHSVYQWSEPTALMLGEFNNFTDDNVKQVKNFIKDVGQVCIQVTTLETPEQFTERKNLIKDKLNLSGISYKAKYIIIEVPNIVTKV